MEWRAGRIRWTSLFMDAALKKSIRPATIDTQGHDRRISEAAIERRNRKCHGRTVCLILHVGVALATLLTGGTLNLVHVHIKNVHAAKSPSPPAKEARSAGAHAPDRALTNVDSTKKPTFTDSMTGQKWSGLHTPWGGSPAFSDTLSFSSHTPSALYTSTDMRATSTAPGGRAREEDFPAGITQAGADAHHLSGFQSATANHETHEKDRKLHNLCANLGLDCAWVEKLLMQHISRGVDVWIPEVRAKLRLALEKTAELVRENEPRPAVDITMIPPELQQQRSLTERVLEEPLEQPLYDSPVDPQMYAPVHREERTLSGAVAAEARENDIEGEATESVHAANIAASRHAASVHADGHETSDAVKLIKEPFGLQSGHIRSPNTVELTYEDTEGVQQVFNEVMDSLKQNRELQHLLDLPSIRDVSDGEAEDEGQTTIEEITEAHAYPSSIQKNDDNTGKDDRSPTVFEAAEATSADGSDEEEAGSTTGAANDGRSAATVEQRRQSLLLNPHHTARFMTRPVKGTAAWHRMHPVGTLNVGQLEALLLSRRKQQRPAPRTPRSLVFPSCYFNAPLQKRMREKASLLITALEQLTDAIEALTELGEVVEKHTEVVERAASTRLYHLTAAEEATQTAKLLPGAVDDERIKRNRKQPNKDNGETAAEILTRKRGRAAVLNYSKTGLYKSRSHAFEEKEVSPADGAVAEATAVSVVHPQIHDHTNDETYRKLVGGAGVREQLHELFAAWELARRTAAAAKTATEVMRRAELLRRNLVLPLQQDVHELSLLDATLIPHQVALQRLSGCKGFIRAVRRTVSRTEEDLYHLGAHAFANEASLPLIAHDLQKYLAGMLEHVVKTQQRQYHVLNERAAYLKALHRVFYRTSKDVQHEAARQLKSSHHLLATPAQDWQETAQRLGGAMLELRVDFARQMVAVKNLNKKMTRFVDICHVLKAGLGHLLQVQLHLQQMRRHSKPKQGRLWLTVENMEGVAQMQTEADSELVEEPTQMLEPLRKRTDETEATQDEHPGVTQKTALLSEGSTYEHIREIPVEPPLQTHGMHADARVVPEHEGEVLEKDEEKSLKFLERLLSKVYRMGEVLHVCKTQASEAEQLLRHGFDAAQESVQKVVTVAQTLTAYPVTMDPKHREQKICEAIPLLARSIQRQEVARAKIKAAVEESAGQLEHLGRQVRYISAALATTEDPVVEEHPSTAREVIARLERINKRLFTYDKLHSRRRQHNFELPQPGEDDSEGGEETFEEPADSVNGENVIDHKPPAGREYLGSHLVSTLESVDEAQYKYVQKRQALETLDAGLRESRIALEINLRILAEVKQVARSKLSTLAIRNASRREEGILNADMPRSHTSKEVQKGAAMWGRISETDDWFGGDAEDSATDAAVGKSEKRTIAREAEHTGDDGKKFQATEASDLHRTTHVRPILTQNRSAQAELGKTDATKNRPSDSPAGKPASELEVESRGVLQKANGPFVLGTSGSKISAPVTEAQLNAEAEQAGTIQRAERNEDDEDGGQVDEPAEEDEQSEEGYQTEEEEVGEGEQADQSEFTEEEADAEEQD